MTEVMITIVAPLDPAQLQAAQTAIDALGNPAIHAIAAKLDLLEGDKGVHFMSLHALPSFTQGRAHLLFEFSADGDAARAIKQICTAIEAELSTVFSLATDWRADSLARYLTRHIITTGFGLGQSPGVAHCGTPGMTVGRIRAESDLASSRIAPILAAQDRGMTALARLSDVRQQLAAQLGPDSEFLKPGDAAPAFKAKTIGDVILPALIGFALNFLWPLLALWLLGCVACGFAAVHHMHNATDAWLNFAARHGELDHGRELHLLGWRGTISHAPWLVFLHGAVRGLISGAVMLVIVTVGWGLLLYSRLRAKEESDWISARAPDHATLREIIARENVYAHNHMISLTELKPGWLRTLTTRLTFWAIGTVGPMLYRPGCLGSIGTIHFARWVTIPGTRDFIFVSNYGGSWESYLEDFITLAHDGLTGVWSNTVGFPKTSNLINQGATDGERFKRYARQSMLPTRFWYSAYPDLVTDTIRTNAAIRRGLSGAMTEDDAALWLSRFGSALRPGEKLVTSEIQSLLFGGLGFLPYSSCGLWALPSETAYARAWLKDIAVHIAYNDGRRVRDDERINAIVQLAISAKGLAALGLPDEGLNTFPPAFLDDMTFPGRARILGDLGANAAENWWWGQESADIAVLIYGQNPAAFAALNAEIDAIGRVHGARRMHMIPLQDVDPHSNFEPFGFADGGSQPVIKGTYKGLKDGDPLHVVAPGEFIMGYPDNRDNMPPGPCMHAINDPANMLPLVHPSHDFAHNDVNHLRALGYNGSYLVIRQLEQDVDAFNTYCDAEATRLKSRLAPPFTVSAEFIGAKMVGRWKNGSPLVRAPYSPSQSNPIINENGFELGLEDPEGLRCPFGAHIRRSNPRDSLNPGSEDQIAISNRHRILRVGRKYVPQPGQKPGLLFMCLNGDLERQFEFVQQTWVLGNVISLSCPMSMAGESDPLLGSGATGHNGYTIPSRDGPVKLSPMPRFVTTRGGGYFLLPGKRLIAYLSS
jgi:deferrochelatase/peroxidase EfeB